LLGAMGPECELLLHQPWHADLAADPFAAVFRKHFAALRAAHQAQPSEGVLIAAIDGNGVFDAHAHLRLPPSGIAHLIVGRHERCDVVLPRDQEVLPPPQPLKSRAAPSPGAVKLATITIQSSSPQAGDLTSTHAVWSDQLERGILVGRDDRCSHGGLDEGNLSRVHLVLLSVDDEVWAIDTASTNGTRVLDGPPFRQLLLTGETQLVLADALSLSWAPALHPARA